MLWWRLNNDTMDSSEFRCVLCFRTRIVKCFNKERIWLFWASLDCWEEIELKNLLCPAMLPRPRTPSPSACCGNGCTPCVMDLHQQVAWNLGCVRKPGNDWIYCQFYLGQEVEMWERESSGREEKCSTLGKLQPLDYMEFEVATNTKLTTEWHEGSGDGEGFWKQ